jgi:hypothetical protein
VARGFGPALLSRRSDHTERMEAALWVLVSAVRFLRWEEYMSILKAFGAVAMLVATSFTPASTQAVVSEPG